MKLSLKYKLTISYILLSLVMILFLIFVTDEMFKNEFANYVYMTNEENNTKNNSNHMNGNNRMHGDHMMGYSQLDIDLVNKMQRIHFIIGIVFFIIAGVIGYLMAKNISNPILIVSEKTKKIEKGNYEEQILIESKTKEIDDLITSVNNLSETLKIQHNIKKQMAIDYSHEIRTPLTCVTSTIEGMIDGILEVTPERLENIQNEMLRLSDMIDDVDRLVETTNNEIILNKSSFNISLLMNEVLKTFENQLKIKNINLYSEHNNLDFYGDKEKIRSVMINLISNAFKYTDEKGYITTKIYKDKNYIIISVKDDGIGISEEEIPYIFEYMYRVEKSRVRDIEGFGIGLSLCKNIVLAHDGYIEVKSKIGLGSEFIVYIKSTH